MLNLKHASSQEDTEEEKEFYGESFFLLQTVIKELMSRIEGIRKSDMLQNRRNPIEHCEARIKSARSMRDKLRKRNLPVRADAAMNHVYDAAGIRMICTFADDVYRLADAIRGQGDIRVVEEKDYIKDPKPNGYRSYHMIIQMAVAFENQLHMVFAEIQIRTLAMDCWASLEHQLKYKHDIPNQELIVQELKRCADEIASTDLTLQTIRDLIEESLET